MRVSCLCSADSVRDKIIAVIQENRVEEATEQAVINFAIAFPAHGQVRVSNELRKKGIFVSPSGVRSVWLRHDLASMKQRLRLGAEIR